MDNQQFLDVIKQSFIEFLNTNSRSNAKLKILHGAIAHDLAKRLGDNYQIKSLGYGHDKEAKIQGRYINKTVDITILKSGKPIAGIGIKFVMQNYAQNANNYFENMLGETANIRSNNIPYFQIFIIPNQLPYYKNNGDFSKWEIFNNHHFDKYAVLSHDNTEIWVHAPTKTLLYTINFPQITRPNHKADYINHYLTLENHGYFYVNTSFDFTNQIGANLIINDYETFIKKVVYRILSE